MDDTVCGLYTYQTGVGLQVWERNYIVQIANDKEIVNNTICRIFPLLSNMYFGLAIGHCLNGLFDDPFISFNVKLTITIQMKRTNKFRYIKLFLNSGLHSK